MWDYLEVTVRMWLKSKPSARDSIFVSEWKTCFRSLLFCHALLQSFAPSQSLSLAGHYLMHFSFCKWFVNHEVYFDNIDNVIKITCWRWGYNYLCSINWLFFRGITLVQLSLYSCVSQETFSNKDIPIVHPDCGWRDNFDLTWGYRDLSLAGHCFMYFSFCKWFVNCEVCFDNIDNI